MTVEKRSRGRPQKPLASRSTEVISIRVTKAEKEAITLAAELNGMSKPKYVNQVLVRRAHRDVKRLSKLED